MTDTKPSEIEKEILSIMDKFTVDSNPDADRSNFESLKSRHKQLMTRAVADEFKDNEFSPFLKNCLEEFDNTYASGLSESIINALKNGNRTDLTKDWRK
jgi:hypothetical protein